MSKESTIRQLKHVRMICCGDYHSACLVEPGFVYTWGRGQVIGRESRDPPPPVSATSATPVRRGSLMSVASQGSLPSYVGRARASSMQLHADLAAALAGAGAEGDSCQPEVVSYFHRRRVQHICSGEGHLIARSGSELFAWGDNRHGQVSFHACAFMSTGHDLISIWVHCDPPIAGRWNHREPSPAGARADAPLHGERGQHR